MVRVLEKLAMFGYKIKKKKKTGKLMLKVPGNFSADICAFTSYIC